MAVEITVAIINSDRLNLKTFPVAQQEVQLKIEGDNDPDTLQRLRDHIEPSVQHHKEIINKYIATNAVAIARAASPEKAGQIGKQARNGLEELLRSAVPKVQASAENFYRTGNEAKRVYESGRVKFWARHRHQTQRNNQRGKAGVAVGHRPHQERRAARQDDDRLVRLAGQTGQHLRGEFESHRPCAGSRAEQYSAAAFTASKYLGGLKIDEFKG